MLWEMRKGEDDLGLEVQSRLDGRDGSWVVLKE